jgi:thiamine biosynthesis lipoprotein
MQTYSFRAMGSQILIAMDTDSGTLNEAGLEAAGWFEEWEQTFSRFRITSELSELNQHTGQFWQVSSNFWRVFNLALDIERTTDGLVTPTILNALEEAGYGRSFEEMPQNIEALLAHSFAGTDELNQIEIDEENRAIRLPHGVRLDLGGVVKGWAARQTMIRLRDTAPVLVDAGGDIAVSGPMRNGSPWAIGITDPINEGQSAGLVMLSNGGIATSGRDYRRWKQGNQWKHHIIDPRIDAPAETDVLTATVIAPDLSLAEAWSKTALILGSEAGKQRLDQQEGIDYLLVDENGKSIESLNFAEYRWTEKWQIRQNSLLA